MLRFLKLLVLTVFLFVLMISTVNYTIKFTKIPTNYSLKGYNYLGCIDISDNLAFRRYLYLYINNENIVVINGNDVSRIHGTMILKSAPISSRFFTWQTVKNYAEYETNFLAVVNDNGTPSLECYIVDIAHFKMNLKWKKSLPTACNIVVVSDWKEEFDNRKKILLHSSDKKHVYILDYSGKILEQKDFSSPVFVSDSYFIYDGKKLYDLTTNAYYNEEIPGSVEKAIIDNAFHDYGNMFIYNGFSIYSITFKGRKLRKIIDINNLLSANLATQGTDYVTTTDGLYGFFEQLNILIPIPYKSSRISMRLSSVEEDNYCSKLCLDTSNGKTYASMNISYGNGFLINSVYYFEPMEGNFIDMFTNSNLYIVTDKGIYKSDVSFSRLPWWHILRGQSGDPFDIIGEIFD